MFDGAKVLQFIAETIKQLTICMLKTRQTYYLKI